MLYKNKLIWSWQQACGIRFSGSPFYRSEERFPHMPRWHSWKAAECDCTQQAGTGASALWHYAKLLLHVIRRNRVVSKCALPAPQQRRPEHLGPASGQSKHGCPWGLAAEHPRHQASLHFPQSVTLTASVAVLSRAFQLSSFRKPPAMSLSLVRETGLVIWAILSVFKRH